FLVAGSLIGWGLTHIILKSAWLSQSTIRFLRIAMWIPFLLLFGIPAYFSLGIAATTLAVVYHYLSARLYLKYSNWKSFSYTLGEVALQSLFFALLIQRSERTWGWMLFGSTHNIQMGAVALVLILILVLLINLVFRRSFFTECEKRLAMHGKELQLSNKLFPLGVGLLTIGWILVWQTACITMRFDSSLCPIPALERVGEFLITASSWGEMRTSMVEIGGGIIFGSLLALATSIFLARSEAVTNVASQILQATYITPIVLWMFAFIFVFPHGAYDHHGLGTFFLGEGHKIMGVGFLVFFPCIRSFWAFRDSPVGSQCLMAIADALPIAFVAMCFGEMFAGTAGLGFQMVIASATFQYEQTLAWFFITLTLLAALSTIFRIIERVSSGGQFGVEAIKPEIR
ncbi:MAG TPA: hypothetical protein V6C65_35795, partial [Allocoleopsis sp.]